MTSDDLEIVIKCLATLSLPHMPKLVTIGSTPPFDLEMTYDDLETIIKIFTTLT